MTSKRIVCDDGNGGVWVVIPAPEYISQLMAGGMTEAQAVAAVAAKDVPVGKQFEIIDKAAMPQNKENRDLWTLSGKTVEEQS